MARFEDLEISADVFEPATNSRELIIPLMEEYPSPKNTFDVFLGNDGSVDTAGAGGNIPWQEIGEGVGAVAGTLLANQDGTNKMLRQRCGRRPLLRKNRAEYDECRERFFREMQGISGSGGGMTQEQLLEIMRQQNADSKKGKIGTAGIIGIVLGVVAVGTAVYFIARKK